MQWTDREGAGQQFVVERLGIGQPVVAARQRVVCEVEAPIRRAVEALARTSDGSDQVVRQTAHVQTSVDGFVVRGVDPHHAHHQTDPGDRPTPPAIDRFAQRDERRIQNHGLGKHQRGSYRAAIRQANAGAPLPNLGGYGKQRQRAVFGNRGCQLCGMRSRRVVTEIQAEVSTRGPPRR